MKRGSLHPYELNKGDSKAVLEKWQTKIAELFRKGGYRKTKKLYREILADFSQIKRTKEKKHLQEHSRGDLKAAVLFKTAEIQGQHGKESPRGYRRRDIR